MHALAQETVLWQQAIVLWQQVHAKRPAWTQCAIESGKQPMRWMCEKVSEAESIWLRSARKILALRNSSPAPYLEVRYEDATRVPKETAKRISDFVGIQYRADEFSTFIESYKPVNADSWRMEIPEIESQLSPEFITALRQLGYS